MAPHNKDCSAGGSLLGSPHLWVRDPVLACRVYRFTGLRLRILGPGFGVYCLGLRIQVLGFGVGGLTLKENARLSADALGQRRTQKRGS